MDRPGGRAAGNAIIASRAADVSSLRILPLLLLLFPTAPLSAQEGVILGRVVDAESGAGIPATSIVVRSAADSSVVNGDVSDPGGRFRVEGLRAGSYTVEVSVLGYASPPPIPVTLAGPTDTVSVGTIRLRVEAIELEEVTVLTERPPVVFAPDRTIYAAEGLAVAAGGTGTELLESIPELDVDIDGSVRLRGSAPAIYINGRPAPMDGEALNIFLQNFPADAIDRVEVMANPSARYQAEGAGGIVDIVLKEDVDLGVNGSVFANGSSRGDLGGGGRASWQRGALTLSGGTNVRWSSEDERSSDLRHNLVTDPATILERETTSERIRLSGGLDLSAELEVGEGGRLWSEVRADRNVSDSDRDTYSLETTEGGELLERYDRLSSGESSRVGLDVAIGYELELGEDHELEAELSYEQGREDDLSRIDVELLELGEGGELPPELSLDETGEDGRELSLEVDWARPLGEKTRIEVGVRSDLEDTDNARLLRVWKDAEGGAVVPDERGFAFREATTAAYLTASRRLGDFSIQLGGRVERTGTRLELPGGDAFDDTYLSFFPSAHASWDVGGGKRVRASYSRRVRRPSPWVINPIDQSSDPLERRVGNPDIDPQYTDSWSLGMSWSGDLGSVRFSPYYRKTVGDWARITTVDVDGISTERWENLASREAYGTSFTASFRRSRRFRGSASLSTFREVRDASNLAPYYSGSSFRWSLRGNGSAQIDPSLSLQGMIRWSPPEDTPQGRRSGRTMTHVAVRKRLLDGRASVNLRVTDPFDLYSSSFVTRDPTHVQTGRSGRSIRQLTASVSWTFSSMERGGRGGDRGRRDRRR